MSTKMYEIKWKLFNYKNKKLLIYGLKNGFIDLYDQELIFKLRNVYYGCLPASIILLSDFMCNGYCYDRALLLAKAFLDTDDDINLIYASIDSIRLNPTFISDNPRYSDHCFLERITADGRKYIYDTSNGMAYDKNLYWKIENPKVRTIRDKSSIVNFWNNYENGGNDKFFGPILIPMIEAHYGDSNEKYAFKGIELLQREVEHYKKIINCDEINRIKEELKVFVK